MVSIGVRRRWAEPLKVGGVRRWWAGSYESRRSPKAVGGVRRSRMPSLRIGEQEKSQLETGRRGLALKLLNLKCPRC